MFNTSKVVRCLCKCGFRRYCQRITTIKSSKVITVNSTSTFRSSHNLANKVQTGSEQSVSPVNKFVNRTHTCGELTINNVGELVRLSGWLEYQRLNKFVVLRDGYGSTQIIVPDNNKELSECVRNLTYESVLNVTGTVISRPNGQENKKMKTGDIEVQVETLEVLNSAKAQLPFSIREHNKAKEQLQMKYRYLAFRFPELQRNLRLRSIVLMKMREYLINCCNFVDIETPTLFKRTPGGAQEFVVPTRRPGRFYSLVQSPQQFKQLLMVGGLDRYFQIARCYRDESYRNDKQPEFTQLDIEMSFTDREGLMNLIEGLLEYCWPAELSPIKVPFKRMTYNDAMELYGTEQPDLTIPYQIQNVTELVKSSNTFMENMSIGNSDTFAAYAIAFPNGHTRFKTFTKTDFEDVIRKLFPDARFVQMKMTKDWKSQLDTLFSNDVANSLTHQFNLKDGDTFFLSYGQKIDAQQIIGKLRVDFAKIMEYGGVKIKSSNYEFLWIVDFPLFSTEKTHDTVTSTHHPFTQPHPEDMELLATNPLKVRSLHYDLVMNGSEIGGGSIRIHDPNLQEKIFKMLNIDSSQMTHLLEALASGAPPHCGIALGLDRFVALLCNAASIREVIAFPKTMEGNDLMSGAPDPISDEDQKLYHIKTLDK